MRKRIAIIQGHPDPGADRFCHALADAYAAGARAGGHELKTISVGSLDFPLLRTKEDFETRPVPPSIQQSQDIILWAEHMVILYPLWHGTFPALLKAFFEQVFRYGFALGGDEGKMPRGLLTGKSARLIVTMGMPAFIYRWYFGAHSLKSLERNILKLSGIGPIKETLIGMVDAPGKGKHEKWLEKMRALGEKGI